MCSIYPIRHFFLPLFSPWLFPWGQRLRLAIYPFIVVCEFLTISSKLWRIFQEMGISDHLTCLLRNLYAAQEAKIRIGLGTTDWFQIGKGVRQGCILSPCLFNLYVEYIMRNAELEEAQLDSRLPGEISITSDMQITPLLWQKVKNSRASWWKWKGEWKSWFKAQHLEN